MDVDPRVDMVEVAMKEGAMEEARTWWSWKAAWSYCGDVRSRRHNPQQTREAEVEEVTLANH